MENKITELLINNWKYLAGAVGILVLIGAIYTLSITTKQKKEKTAQEQYFLIEKKLLELKAKSEAGEDDKKNVVEKPDFTSVSKELETFIDSNPKRLASKMAAIHLAKIHMDSGNLDLGLSTLEKVRDNENGVVSTLVLQQMGQIMALKDKCSEAIQIWQSILNNKNSSYIHDDVKIQQALCYVKTNDHQKAEEILTNLANKSVNPDMQSSSSSKDAEKYLRLLKFKKATGT